MTKFERVVGLSATLIACAAAVIVVPEVRCKAGLDTGAECKLNSLQQHPLVATTGLSPFRPSMDPQIGEIADLYNWIENNRRDADTATMELRWSGADRVDATVYRLGSGIPKIRVRVYEGSKIMSYLFYYSGEEMVFTHQVWKHSGVPSPRENIWDQRFYFRDGQLLRWLTEGKKVVDESHPQFASHSEQLSDLASRVRSLVLTEMSN